VVLVAGEGEETGEGCGGTTKGGAVEVEAETACCGMIAVGDLSGIARENR
jgi:hypothetical protein